MKTEWDYSNLAVAYLKRPDYADAAIDAMLKIAGVSSSGLKTVCDVGAGVAHLTRKLAERGLNVTAVEPNDSMRGLGIQQTAQWPDLRWIEGVGEATGCPDDSYDLVTFGSSFNVCDRPKALQEAVRILKAGGWFACMWNHRLLSDPVQSRIEAIIGDAIPAYSYGTRREDQTDIIDASGLFGPVVQVSGRVMHSQTIEECVEAWRSHATLERQAGAAFPDIVAKIAAYLESLGTSSLAIPYTTHIWLAQSLRAG